MANKVNKEMRMRILRESYHMFMHKKYDEVTTRDIADVCGLSRSNLHYYYNKKEEILLDILSAISKQLYVYFFEKNSFYRFGEEYQLYFIQLSFGHGKKRPGLEALFWELFNDTEMMYKYILSLNYFEKKGGLDLNDKQDVGVLVFYGTLSQLATLRRNGAIQSNMYELTNMAYRAKMAYEGSSEEDMARIFEKIAVIDLPSEIDAFTAYYEEQLDWND